MDNLMDVKNVQTGEGKYCISCTCVKCGQDLTLILTGGTMPHVGAVALGVYEPERDSATVSNLTVYTHRDDVLARVYAKKAATLIKGTASVTVGIHIDNATKEELELIQKNCQECFEKLMNTFS